MYLLHTITILLIVLELHAVTGKKITNADETPGNVLPNPIVKTTKGSVRGSVILTDRGNWGQAFQRIPYAAPPTGANRFKPPRLVEPWSGTLDGTEFGPCCWQLYSLFDEQRNKTSSEDCLTLNVYAPLRTENKLESDNGSAVVLFYMGGAWQNDDAEMYPIEPLIDNFVSREVIMIIISYRVNIFGGFTNGKDDFPGNNALRDYIAGLHWIQQEIRAFGGDPDRVTIMGDSSGAVGVSLISLSPAAQGLFHNVIAMSGTSAAAGSVQRGAEIPASADFAKLVGCNSNDEWNRAQDTVISCLQHIEPEKLLTAYILSGKTEAQTPRIDGPGGIIPEEPIAMMAKRCPYPLLTGTLTKEAVFFLGDGGAPLYETIGTFTSDTAEMLCEQLGNASFTGEGRDGGKVIGDACKEFYNLPELKLHRPDSDHSFWFETVIDISDARVFFAPSFLEADSMRKSPSSYPVYLYSFEYVKKGLEGLAPFHALDLWHLMWFPVSFYGLDLGVKTVEDAKIDQIYANLFCNFIKFGNPTPIGQIDFVDSSDNGSIDILPIWKPLGGFPDSYNYYSINLVTQNMPFYHYSDVRFWNKIVPCLSETESNQDAASKAAKVPSKKPCNFSELQINKRLTIHRDDNNFTMLDAEFKSTNEFSWVNEAEVVFQLNAAAKLERFETKTAQILKLFEKDPEFESFVNVTAEKVRDSMTISTKPIGLIQQENNAESLNAVADYSESAASSSTLSSLMIQSIVISTIMVTLSIAGLLFAAVWLIVKRRQSAGNVGKINETTRLLPIRPAV